MGAFMQTLTDFKIEYTAQAENGSFSAIIVAAGNSVRMQGISKQFAELCGIPIIVHTLSAFQRANQISEIILVTKREFIADISNLANRYSITKLKNIVEGGDNRQESVKNGLKAISKATKYVLIHDGARPLITQKTINSVINELGSYDCVACGVPIVDTVKEINKDFEVLKTVDRSHLISIQTPQGVNAKKYLQLLETADLECFTDDASIFEAAGIPVKIVEGDRSNIKVTVRNDIALAEFYLERQAEE